MEAGMAYSHTLVPAFRQGSLFGRVSSAVRKVWLAYWTHKAERTAVFALRSLDDRTLKDIGLDRSEIESVVHGRASAASAAERRVGTCAKSRAGRTYRPDAAHAVPLSDMPGCA
jgi:uncharacterized protein YjiS (DUF1127 family)